MKDMDSKSVQEIPKQRPPVKELLAPKEVAAILGVSERTVRHWVRSGQLPAIRLGRKLWRISHSELQAYLDARQTTR